MNKRINKYFDWKFENGIVDTRPYGTRDLDWTGIWIDDFLVVGYPENNSSEEWFSNGPYFSGGADLFGVTYREFYNAMTMFLNSKYPDIKIKTID
jgi:hypothetical protein